MIPVKFGPFQTNRFDVIAILVNFNRRPAAILDFAKFHFWPHSHVCGAEAKLGLKFNDNRICTSRVIQLWIKIQDGVGGHLVFWISGYWAQCLVAALVLMRCAKFCEDRPYRSRVISISVSHWNAWERGFLTILRVKKFSGNFLTPQRHLLGPDRFFWRITRQNRFRGLGCTMIHDPPQKT